MQTQYNDPKGQAGSLKAPLGLVPPHAMEQTAWVHKLGADKYGPWNWRETGVCASTYVNAILRHLNAWRDGEDLDPESGISHLAHVACSANILMDAEYCGKLQDDRNTTLPHTDPAEDDWSPLDEEDPKISLFSKLKAAVDSATFDREKFYRTLEKGDTVEEGDEHRFIDDWYPAPKDVIGAPVSGMVEWRRKITNCDLWGSLDEEKEDLRVKLLKSFFKLDKYAEAGVEDDCPEAGYRILKEDEELQDGDEVYVGEGHWCPVYVASWATPSIVYRGTYRRKVGAEPSPSLVGEGYRRLKAGEPLKKGDEFRDFDKWFRVRYNLAGTPACEKVVYRRKITKCDESCDSEKEPQDKVADCDLEETCDSKSEPQEECKCGRRYVYHWLYGWICEDCDLKLSDYYP